MKTQFLVSLILIFLCSNLVAQTQRQLATIDHPTRDRQTEFCHFQGKAWGQLTIDEFVKFDPHSLKCQKNRGRVVKESVYLPILPPILPITYNYAQKEDRKGTFFLDKFAFLFPVMGNIGRKFTRLSFTDNGKVPPLPNVLDDKAPREAQEFVRTIQEGQLLITDELKTRRNRIIKKIKGWKKALGFPFSFEEALKMSTHEMWSFESENAILLGPTLSKKFIFTEKIRFYGHLNGGSLASINFMLRKNHRVTVRKIQRLINGKMETRLQLKYQGQKNKRTGLTLGGNGLGIQENIGTILLNTSLNLLAGTVFQMSLLNILPVNASWFWHNDKALDFVLEFDPNDGRSKQAYEDAISGDFRTADLLIENALSPELSPAQYAYQGKVNKIMKKSDFKIFLPFVFSGNWNCSKDSVQTSQEYHDGQTKASFEKGKVCFREFNGSLHNFLFGRFKSGGGFWRGEFRENKSVVERGAFGTYKLFDEKINLARAQNELDFISELFPHLNNQLKLEEKVKDSNLDMNLSFFVSEKKLNGLAGKSEGEIFKLLKEAFNALRAGEQTRVFMLKENNGHKTVAEVFVDGKRKRVILKDPESRRAFEDIYKRWVKISKQPIEAGEKLDQVLQSFKKHSYLKEYFKVLFKSLERVDNDLEYILYVNSQGFTKGQPLLFTSENIETLSKSQYQEQHLVASNKVERDWIKATQFDGSEKVIPRKVVERVLDGSEGIRQVQCECQYKNERDDEAFSLDLVSFSLSNVDGEKLSDWSKRRLNYQCLRSAQSNALFNSDHDSHFDVQYVRVPTESCQTKAETQLTSKQVQTIENEQSQFLSLLEEQVQKEERCEKYLVFKNSPKWLRYGLATILGGFGWRARGGGYHELRMDGDISGVMLGTLANMTASYLGANTCQAFVDGAVAAYLINIGEKNGWGGFFDMGAMNDDILDHDLPGMTVRGTYLTGIAAGYLKNKGYDFSQERTGNMLGLYYLMGRALAKYDGGKKHGIHNYIIENDFLAAIEADRFTGFGEFVTGLSFGFELARTAYKGSEIYAKPKPRFKDDIESE